MNALTRLFHRLRNGADDRGDSPAGSPVQRILDIEIRGADERLHTLRAELASVASRRAAASEDLQATVSAIDAREAQAIRALQAEKHSIAREIAGVIAALEQQRAREQDLVRFLGERTVQLEADIETWTSTLRRLKHQLDTVRASEGVQLAQAIVANRQSTSAALPRNALEAAQRMKARQLEPQAGTDGQPPKPQSTDLLDARLRDAGILETNPQIAAVIERLQCQIPTPATKAPRRRSTRTATDGIHE
ncbi:PspA/IM30 family protein [Lysobacter korlensis]|uniref:PspA/IM30 family protein n=1 Tax=Lysobacter korlensis TaxID=553636 RepID=A0ABV6RS05_9GAMM